MPGIFCLVEFLCEFVSMGGVLEINSYCSVQFVKYSKEYG